MTYEWLWQNCEMQGISQIHASKIWLNFQFEKVAFWCEYFCILKADLNLEDYDLRPSQDEDGDELADLQPEPDRPDQHSVQQHLQLHLHEEQVRLWPQHQINKLLQQIQELDIWCLFLQTAFMIKLSLLIVKCNHIGHFSLIVAPRNWVFGVLFCRLTAFMTHLSIVASVLTMAAIAGERLPSWFVTFWWSYLEENVIADTWSRRSHADLTFVNSITSSASGKLFMLS